MLNEVLYRTIQEDHHLKSERAHQSKSETANDGSTAKGTISKMADGVEIRIQSLVLWRWFKEKGVGGLWEIILLSRSRWSHRLRQRLLRRFIDEAIDGQFMPSHCGGGEEGEKEEEFHPK